MNEQMVRDDYQRGMNLLAKKVCEIIVLGAHRDDLPADVVIALSWIHDRSESTPIRFKEKVASPTYHFFRDFLPDFETNFKEMQRIENKSHKSVDDSKNGL